VPPAAPAGRTSRRIKNCFSSSFALPYPPAVEAAIAREVEHYLATGESDPAHFAWRGHVMERAEQARRDLRRALIREVERRAQGRTHPPLPAVDTAKLTRAKLEPMVRGLFPRSAQEPVLAALAPSVVFVSSSRLEALLFEVSFDDAAWDLANLYLASVGAETLGADARQIVGFCAGHTCYVSPLYFTRTDPFADFVLHETVHLFHHVKRRHAGCARRAPVSGSSTSPTRSARPSPTPAKRTAASSSRRAAAPSGRSSRSRMPRRCALSTRPSTPPSSVISSSRHAERETGGRRSSRTARRRHHSSTAVTRSQPPVR
jgi:hypothetical protein